MNPTVRRYAAMRAAEWKHVKTKKKKKQIKTQKNIKVKKQSTNLSPFPARYRKEIYKQC